MVDLTHVEDAILLHLHEVAHTKRALLEVATKIQGDYPTDAHLLLTTIRTLTRSADKLLGDTVVDVPPTC